jgi:hypothetical protein
VDTHTPEKLLSLWAREKITAEMAIGHILQNLVQIQAMTASNSRALHQLRREVDGLLVHSGIKPRAKKKPSQEN